jgi:ribosomal protein S2
MKDKYDKDLYTGDTVAIIYRSSIFKGVIVGYTSKRVQVRFKPYIWDAREVTYAVDLNRIVKL